MKMKSFVLLPVLLGLAGFTQAEDREMRDGATFLQLYAEKRKLILEPVNKSV
jgi:hypothetical protein